MSTTSSPDCIPVVALQSCHSQLSYILAELSNRRLKASYLPGCWKFWSLLPVFSNVGERCMAKNYCLFSDFQHRCRSSWLIADLLTVVCYKIAKVWNRSGATCDVACDISKASDRVWHADLLYKLKSYGILGEIFALI